MIFVVVKILVVFKIHFLEKWSGLKILKIKAFNSVIIITSVIIRASPGNGRIVFHLD